MNTRKLGKPLAAFLCALVFALCGTAASAEAPAREGNAAPPSPVKIRLKEKSHDAEWIVLENSDCQFFFFYNEKSRKYRARIGMNDCASITNSGYKLVGDDVLVANFASERGAYVYIFHASENRLYWVNEKYDASDESGFSVSSDGADILIETDKTRITARILKTGKVEIRKE